MKQGDFLMKIIKAILFDMDGVLIEAKDWHYEALNKALGLFGFEIERYDHLVTYDGLPTRKKLEYFSIENGLSRNLHDFINNMKQIYTTDLVNLKCKPIFNHRYALSRLKNEGYKIVVCSNSIKKTIEIMMDKAALTEYLDFYLSNEDVVNPKPNPEIYIKAINKLKMKPTECVILEDNKKGIEAALASGAYLLEINDVKDVNYDNIINKINEIEEKTND